MPLEVVDVEMLTAAFELAVPTAENSSSSAVLTLSAWKLEDEKDTCPAESSDMSPSE
jgi:hypothetical protein